MFINRKDELVFLEKLYKSERSQFLILYGRRRIGKTELLKYFGRDKKHLYFFADLSLEKEQIRQFTEKIYNLKGEDFLKGNPFSSWESLFNYLFDHLAEEYPLIIIDEFPYLCFSNKALPSILQKVWDEKGKKRKVFIILCGSYMSFMEKETLSSKSPLYGRRTGQILLDSFKFRDIKEFFPGYGPEDLVTLYSVLGGTPAYLEIFDKSRTIEENIKEEILYKNSFLYKEPRFLLMEELREPSIYFAILKAVAAGKTVLNQIFQDTGLESINKANKYLSVLRDLKIIKREVPVTEKQPHKSRKGIYLLQDSFFRFWFRFIYPNQIYIEEGEIDYLWEKKIEPYLQEFAAFNFEEVCRQKLLELNKRGELPFKAEKIGRWWDGKKEIDIVALNEEGHCLFCECKWSVKKVGLSIYRDLQEKSRRITGVSKSFFGFFSKSGFSEDLLKLSEENSNIILFDYSGEI